MPVCLSACQLLLFYSKLWLCKLVDGRIYAHTSEWSWSNVPESFPQLVHTCITIFGLKYWLLRRLDYKMLTDNSLTDFWVFPNGNFSIFTTQKPKSLQYKEPIKRVQHPRNLQLPTLPTLQDCSSWCKLMASQAKSHRRENGKILTVNFLTDFWVFPNGDPTFLSTFTSDHTDAKITAVQRANQTCS